MTYVGAQIWPLTPGDLTAHGQCGWYTFLLPSILLVLSLLFLFLRTYRNNQSIGIWTDDRSCPAAGKAPAVGACVVTAHRWARRSRKAMLGRRLSLSVYFCQPIYGLHVDSLLTCRTTRCWRSAGRPGIRLAQAPFACVDGMSVGDFRAHHLEMHPRSAW